MKILTALLLSLLVAANASAQDNAAQPAAQQAAQAEAGPAPVAAADPPIAAAPGAGGPKTCHARGWNCRLADQSLDVGAHCMCGVHPGNVWPN
ncbi:hypothetical protein LMG27952_04915 [Paraburkholderia hiiakae]|uniref:Uncharacterized protein n=1 Tax=Paraburkholderia hiiakae TaxID=1081782 RepID=A0ABN7I2E7_9BURK|nr:hypothetical protein [Paraburkholderia hiiakae]CAD6549785.1 hypothetical protein LMG27952_04915 [Paraburkholderia hiiakae]